MKRIVDAGIPTLAVGIRSLSAPEAELIRERRPAGDLGAPARPRRGALPADAGRRCRRRSTSPSTSTTSTRRWSPRPARPSPAAATGTRPSRLLRHLFRTKTVVAMDLIELAPIGGTPGERLPGRQADLQVPGLSLGEGRGPKQSGVPFVDRRSGISVLSRDATYSTDQERTGHEKRHPEAHAVAGDLGSTGRSELGPVDGGSGGWSDQSRTAPPRKSRSAGAVIDPDLPP